jgi:hypothetical protein
MRQVADETGTSRDELDNGVRQLQLRLEQQGLQSRRRMVAHDEWLESVQSALARRA